MSQFLFLDSGPLGLLTHPQRSAEVVALTEWLARCLVSGSRVIVPAIVYYELKRELLRTKNSLSIARLDAFVEATPDRYLALSDEALLLAAGLWARSRQAGQPTADAKALDVDVIIAAQAATSSSSRRIRSTSSSFSPQESGTRSTRSPLLVDKNLIAPGNDHRPTVSCPVNRAEEQRISLFFSQGRGLPGFTA